ncbi:alpha/beta hydrolase [Paracidovorax avenae]|uniref:alpha/beta hydrolase n=1 Tax=Paracidovorax avenae TaxID=80867 RepID=UPI000D15FAB5|nr:dienelactone hydrolase family protein [Paracidovorax avenae]AVS81679.1 phospholipase [Paracidovorax avenae]AVS88862.1 phospholipase [Paracidovorax avenae]AVS96201.1 phospholipase [Paracidovorax avenae]AVS99410.1 phospholipase [Paracidovorax avenae]AVT09982.1 phospholipase [Paracidovorax avenae]
MTQTTSFAPPPLLDLPLAFLGRPAAPDTVQPWLLVLMHGVGSHEKDLFSLAPAVPGHFHVLSLRAPYAMGPGANTWFEFSVEPDGSRTIHEAQEIASRSLLARTVESAAAQLGVPPERVVVGGFSQGGIMALSLLLTRPELLQAAMVWHSRLLPQVLPHAVEPAALRGRALWVSHGEQDNVIPLANARALRDHARGLPLALTYREYPGMHEIRPGELREAMDWLAALGAAEVLAR